MRIGFKLPRIVPPRAVLALAFLILSGLHPGLFATANATGFHGDNGMPLSSDARDHHASDAEHDHHAKVVHDEQTDDHSSSTNDTICKVHCAPIQGVPADFSPVFPAVAGCAPQAVLVVAQPGEPVKFKRPPRI